MLGVVGLVRFRRLGFKPSSLGMGSMKFRSRFRSRIGRQNAKGLLGPLADRVSAINAGWEVVGVLAAERESIVRQSSSSSPSSSYSSSSSKEPAHLVDRLTSVFLTDSKRETFRFQTRPGLWRWSFWWLCSHGARSVLPYQR